MLRIPDSREIYKTLSLASFGTKMALHKQYSQLGRKQNHSESEGQSKAFKYFSSVATQNHEAISDTKQAQRHEIIKR